MPNFYITESNFEEITGSGFWTINDIPPCRWSKVSQFLVREDTIAVFASGVLPLQFPRSTTELHGGYDWHRLEANPGPDEPDVNVYHYAIGAPEIDASGVIRYPVCGPIKNGALIEHWPKYYLKELLTYYASSPLAPDSCSQNENGATFEANCE